MSGVFQARYSKLKLPTERPRVRTPAGPKKPDPSECVKQCKGNLYLIRGLERMMAEKRLL